MRGGPIDPGGALLAALAILSEWSTGRGGGGVKLLFLKLPALPGLLTASPSARALGSDDRRGLRDGEPGMTNATPAPFTATFLLFIILSISRDETIVCVPSSAVVTSGFVDLAEDLESGRLDPAALLEISVNGARLRFASTGRGASAISIDFSLAAGPNTSSGSVPT